MQNPEQGHQGSNTFPKLHKRAGQKHFSHRDFIRSLGLLTIVLASCTPGPLKPPDAFQTDTPQPTPTLAEPTATATPDPTATATPTETPTPMPEFRVGITPDMEYEDCNQLHEANIEQELTLLVAKEHEWLAAQGITPDKMNFFSSTETFDFPHVPYAFSRVIPNNVYFSSCSIVQMDNGSRYFVLGMALKHAQSDNISIMHFGVDDQELEAMFSHHLWPNELPPPTTRMVFDAAKNVEARGNAPINPVIFKNTWKNPDTAVTELWPTTTKLLMEYEKRGITWDDYQRYISRGLNEKEVIAKLETMIIPTWWFAISGLN